MPIEICCLGVCPIDEEWIISDDIELEELLCSDYLYIFADDFKGRLGSSAG